MSSEVEFKRGESPTVNVPVGLFDAMAACYYGGGPNHYERKGQVMPMGGRRSLEERMEGDKEGFQEPRASRQLTEEELISLRTLVPATTMKLTPIGAAYNELVGSKPVSATPAPK